jgi:alpha-L-arabinofuranosidase
MSRISRVVLVVSASLLLLAPSGQAEPATDAGRAYLFTFFREPNGNDGLHLAWSRDGYRWEELGLPSHAWIKPTLGNKCMRDPSLKQGPDGVFHLVWTTGWGDKGFGYASSKDLVHWSDQVLVPVNEKVPGARNTWAPELFYDAKTQQWLVIWSTTVEGRFPETAKDGDGNHRLYYVTTKDFKTFSETKLFCDPGFNCIDGTMLEDQGKYYLILKNEPPAKKCLQICAADSAEGPWSKPSEPLPKPGKMVEGPSAIRLGDEYLIYFDAYSSGRYGAVRSRDMKKWEDVTRRVSFPRGFRHGTVLEVSEPMLQSLLAAAFPAQRASISVAVDQPGAKISPMLYGIFFEEINLAGDGGLYAELVRNRSFEDAEKPDHWTLVTTGSAKGEMAIDSSRPRSQFNQRALRLSIGAGQGFVGAANGGYYGIALAKDAVYDLTLIGRCGGGFASPVAVRLENADGTQIYAQGQVEGLAADWKPMKLSLTANATDPKARLVLGASQPGTLWLDFVSLFPQKTWKGRPNGLRPDLAEMLTGLKPSFVRFPGGCWVEGNVLKDASRWKRTIGDLPERWTQWNLWQYYSTNGLGFHEYLQMCEDLGAEPLFVINCGMSHRENVPLDQMAEWIQDALDAIEYATGPADSKWGALRAKAGHPAPFNMKYLEIGNENGGPAYQERYALFYDAIKAKYPQLNLVADVRTTERPTEIVDEHYYSSPEFFISNATRYDSYDRKGPKVYVGEYAVTQNCGQGSLRGAVGEAAFMTGMERNSDVVVMSSYAPLFVHCEHRRWNPDLINFDSVGAYGIPSYYVQQMFSANRGDVVLPAAVEVAQPAETPVYRGAIGLGTWATQAEFKDLQVTKGDQVLFQSDFAQGTKGWRVHQGDWKVKDGALQQSAPGTDLRIVAGDKSWTDYTYRLKARKLGGAEGFLIMFQVQDQDNWLWWNLGGWGNRMHGLEQCTGGGKGGFGQHVPGQIETGRWYDIRIELSGPRVRCYLDGKLIHDASHWQVNPLHVAASRVQATGEVILKVVNASRAIHETRIDLKGVQGIAPEARAIVLTSANAEDENSLSEPTKVSPQTKHVAAGPSFRYTFPGNSVTVLRIQAK